MLNTLLESARPHTVPLGSLAASIGLHLLLGVPAWQKAVGVEAVSDRPQSFITRALFMPPPDRRPAGSAGAERLSWATLGTVPGGELVGGDPAQDGTRSDTRRVTALAGMEVPPVEVELPAPAFALGDYTAYSALQVDDSVARYADSEAPFYPGELLARNIEGSVFVRYIVDVTGIADAATATVLRSSHPEFTFSVLTALPRMRFRPAMIANRPVRQLVQQQFDFRIVPPASGLDTAAVASAQPGR